MRFPALLRFSERDEPLRYRVPVRRNSCAPPTAERIRSLLAIIDSRSVCNSSTSERNAALVFRIGALEVGHFGTNKGLQFPSACQRPLDAVAHRDDLAAYGLRQRHHLDRRAGIVSGAESRTAISAIERAVRLISCARRARSPVNHEEYDRTDGQKRKNQSFRPRYRDVREIIGAMRHEEEAGQSQPDDRENGPRR